MPPCSNLQGRLSSADSLLRPTFVTCWRVEEHADLCRQLSPAGATAGDLFPALGSRDLNRVMQLIGQGVLILRFGAQLGQDALLAGPALQVSQRCVGICSAPCSVELGLWRSCRR